MLDDTTPARARLPYPAWLLIFLGALTCAAWLGAIALGEYGPVIGGAPGWLWNGAPPLVRHHACDCSEGAS